MARTAPLRDASEVALATLRALDLENVRAAVVVCDSFVHESTSGISIESFGAVPVLQFAVAHDSTGVARAGFVAACAQCGIGTIFILAEGHHLDPRMPGDRIVAVTDHINLMGDNPLIGPHNPSLGPRFPDMSEPFSRRMLAAIDVQSVDRPCVYASRLSDETLATEEREQLVRIGVDVVGRWIGPELLCARQRSMKVLAFVAPAGAHYGSVRPRVSGGLYYSQFREVVAAILMQPCP